MCKPSIRLDYKNIRQTYMTIRRVHLIFMTVLLLVVFPACKSESQKEEVSADSFEELVRGDFFEEDEWLDKERLEVSTAEDIENFGDYEEMSSLDAFELSEVGTDVFADEGISADDVTETDLLDGGDSIDEYRQWLAGVSCSSTPPEGAKLAASFPSYSGGQCPVLVAGMNDFVSYGVNRRFLLAVPSNPTPEESYPVLFMYHWLKGSASSFYKKGEVQMAVDQQRFIAVIPEAKGDLDLFGLIDLPWPILSFTPDSRFEEEFRFFDDMLACVSQQFPVNKECVSAVGVSAGALFVVQLAGARSEHLSSYISLSGGTQSDGASNLFIKPYKKPEHKLPALVLWGGPLDSCALLNFQLASIALEDHLIEDGQFFVECIHNCRHGEPPVDAPEGQSKYAAIWEFAFTHPFWLKAGESPILVTGIPSHWPSWCGIGKGSAIPRTGDCPEPGCPL